MAVRRYSEDEIGDLADSFSRHGHRREVLSYGAQLSQSEAEAAAHRVKP